MAITRQMDLSKLGTTALVGLLAAALVYQGVNEMRGPELVAEGQPAPPVVGMKLGGGAFDFAEMQGKAVVVDFFASWCKACKRAAPELVSLAREYRDQGLVLVMADQIAADHPANVGIFMGHVAPEPPDNLHVVLAEEETFASYQVKLLPTTYVLSRDGRVVDGFTGIVSESSLRRAIERALQP